MEFSDISTEKLAEKINRKVEELEVLIKDYGSFNIVANSIFRNSALYQSRSQEVNREGNPVVQEYLALIALKFPYSIGVGELIRSKDVMKDFYQINKIASEIISLHSLLHVKQYNVFDDQGELSDMEQIAMLISSEELSVRNETFEEHHWQRLEGLYEPYNIYFKEKLGFSVDQAIDFCIAISEYTNGQMEKALVEPRASAKQMYDEARAYKYRNKQPNNFYPPEYLERFKKTSDADLKYEFDTSMMQYTVTMLGHFMQFKIQDIVEMGDIDEAAFMQFLTQFSISFGEVNPDFNMPEVIHPLKDRPILRHDDKYFCSSLSLLDYALDRLFASTLFKDPKRIEKYKLHRHEYLNNEGMKYLTDTLKTATYYSNLLYPGGELDGLIFCGNNALFVEAKGHQVTDRAKKGYFDRIQGHIEDVIQESHSQAIRTYNYLKDNPVAQFKYKSGKKVLIDGTQFKNAYFISLTLESFKAVSMSLKVNNSLGIFDRKTFPWIVSLYDLRVVCEHMEGPSYLIQYMHRRREFFSLGKFMASDELDLLAFYLERNLRFDDLLKKYKNVNAIQLDSQHAYFDRYYAAKDGILSKKVPIMKHYTLAPIKKLVLALENSGLENAIDASILILEGGSKVKNQLMDFIRVMRKKYNKDGDNHDFRMIGSDDADDSTWMLSYWFGFDSKDFLSFFEDKIRNQFEHDTTDEFYAILDKGKKEYEFVKILHLRKSAT